MINNDSFLSVTGTTTLENFIAMKNSSSNDDHSQKLLDYRKRRGRPRKDSDIHFETKVSFGKAEGEIVKPNNVKVLVCMFINARFLHLRQVEQEISIFTNTFTQYSSNAV